MKSKYLFIIFSLIIILFSLYSYTYEENELSEEDTWVMDTFSKMTLDERIGQFFIVELNSFSKNKTKKQIDNLILKNKIGGILFRSPELTFLNESIKNVSKNSKTPLFVALDGEVQNFESYDSSINFPSSFTLSVANEKRIALKNGKVKADYLRNLGVNTYFSLNANLISSSSTNLSGMFGEVPLPVSRLISGSVEGLESNGVLVSVKDFPGVGSIVKDSNGLLSLNERLTSLNAVNLLPFREAIKANASFVTMSNAVVRSIDSLGLPMSLSKQSVTFLKNELGFKGLILANGSDLKQLKDFCKPNEFALASFKAGCDLFIGIDDVEKSIKEIELSVLNGDLSLEEVNRRCLQILHLKYKSLVKEKTFSKLSNDEKEWALKEAYEKGFVVFKNKKNQLAIRDLTKEYIHVSIGPYGKHFDEGLDRFKEMKHYHFYTIDEAREELKEEFKKFDHLILSLHENNYQSPDKSILYSGWNFWMQEIDSSLVKTVIAFSSPINLKGKLELSGVDAFALSFENNEFSQERLSQLVGGALPSNGKLTFSVSENYKRGFGENIKPAGRLKYSSLEELGVDSLILAKIDTIVLKSIKENIFPGCQVFAAVDGKVLYNKSFGNPTYDDTIEVDNSNLYDIASVTKVAASTIALMRLETLGKIDMNKQLGDYIPELVIGSEMSYIYLKDMMTHQAGLPSWIPFYFKTLKKGELDSTLYSSIKKEGYETKVADSIWILDKYTDTIYKRILSSRLREKSYKYSDLGYYFVKKIVEKVTNLPFEKYLKDSIYTPMGLSNISYKPLDFFPLQKIIPTEEDNAFRKQLVWGYVHDPGAAMLGGVGGHAGLFSNATDLGALMQMVLNHGKYGNIQFIDSAVVEKYTSCQFCETNRRGLGFDRPKKTGGGTCDKVASSISYGHSGFTGTIVWCDPKYQINYVFLSNRVNPSAENWKIVEQNVRTNIQKVIYDAVGDSKTRIK